MKKSITLIMILLIVFTNSVFAYDDSYQNIEVIDLFIEQDIINILRTGESEFVDIYAKYSNGEIKNITNLVNWESENGDIAYVYNNNNGRILARDIGTTYINISYSNYYKKIKVNVIRKFDYTQYTSIFNNVRNMSTTSDNYLRNQVAAKAKAMIDFSWIPTSNLIGWESLKTFRTGVSYYGIPYSQTINQVDEKAFKNSMSLSNFYSPLTNIYGGLMPRYGNDCSGFLSIAWGITRRNTTYFRNGIKDGTYAKVGSYTTDNPTITQLKNSYKFLKKGDAVVCIGHTFMIYDNDVSNSKIIAYEQTPPNAQMTTWTYNQLANDTYLPFTLKYMDNGDVPNRIIDKDIIN